MVNRLKGKTAVYLVSPAPDWKPQRLWDFPPSFTEGVLHARNLRPRDAIGFARSFNKGATEALQRGEPSQWAIVVRYVRPRYRPRPVDPLAEALDACDGELELRDPIEKGGAS